VGGEALLQLGRVGSEAGGDDVELVELRLAGEERLSVGDLGDDAGGGPDVDLGAVVVRPDEQLGRPVPPAGGA
jgi:hypothetical protein